MNIAVSQSSFFRGVPKSRFRSMLASGLAIWCGFAVARGAETKTEAAWRSLPLITEGHVNEDWCHVGWGGFTVGGDSLRTECDPKGLGLLVYKNERFGNCQIRVVFRSKEAKSNSGVFVRVADGILDQVNKPGAAFDRDVNGKISKPSMQNMMTSFHQTDCSPSLNTCQVGSLSALHTPRCSHPQIPLG